MLVRDDRPNDYGLKTLHNKILEIIIEVDKMCRENGIEYYLTGGAALGAVKYGGFVPWDDDLDIFMTPANYDKFVSLFPEKMDSDKFYFDRLFNLAKVRMNHTTFIEPLNKGKDMHHGIYIDIFVLYDCPNDIIGQLWQYFWAKFIIIQGLAQRGYNLKSGIIGSVINIMKHLPPDMLNAFAWRQMTKYGDRETDYYCHFLDKAVFSNGIYPKNLFGPPVDIEFENLNLMAPQKINEWVEIRFGDISQDPPEKIKMKRHVEIWDVDRGFRHYLPDVKKFEREGESHLEMTSYEQQ